MWLDAKIGVSGGYSSRNALIVSILDKAAADDG